MVVEQKKMPEYNHYAKKSLIFAIISICLLAVFFLFCFSPLNYDPSLSLGFLLFFLFFIPATIVVMAISGAIFSKRGLKSEKVGMSIFGLVISGTVLLSLASFIIWSNLFRKGW